MLGNITWTKFQTNREEWSSSPSFSHPNSFLFHNFTAKEEEQGAEHVKFEVWTKLKEQK
jgi:hypothetical protein